MTAPRPIWSPGTYDDAEADVSAGHVRESHYVELKELVEGGEQGTSKIRKALSSLAIDGGVFVIGVSEDRQTRRAKEVTPVQISGLQERIAQVAHSLDPILTGLRFQTLPVPADDAKGIVLVYIDPSPWAPHKTPNGVYHGRNDVTSYPLSDAEIQHHMRVRAARTERAGVLLDGFWEDQHGFIPQGNAGGYLAVIAAPAPGLWGDPFMQFMGHEYAGWLRRLNEQHGDLVHASRARPERTSTGVRMRFELDPDGRAPTRDKLEIDRDGTVRFLTSRCTDEATTPGSARILLWRDVCDRVRSVVELANDLADQLGRPFGLNLGVELRGIKDYQPQPLHQTYYSHKSWLRQLSSRHELVPYQADRYSSTTAISAAQARGDLVQALHLLLSPLYNSMGLPTFTELDELIKDG